MKPSLFHRMDLWTRNMLPFGATLFLLVLGLVPARVPGYAMIAPVLPLMGVYYWSIYRPDLLPPSAAFGLGLLHDILSGLPLGVSALVMLTVQGITSSQRRFFLGNTFAVAWWGFALMALGTLALTWLLVCMLFVQIIPPKTVMFQYLITISAYPVVSWLLARTQVVFLRQQ